MTQRLAPWHQVKTLRKGVLKPASSAISLIPSRRIEDIWSLLYWAYCDYIVYDTPFTLLRLTWRRPFPHRLHVDLIDKSIARIISVNESFCICLSTTWTDCTINQKVLISKLALFIHWCLCEQGRNSVTRFNSSLSMTECRDYSFFDFNTSGWVKSKEICLSYICTEGLAVQAMALCPSPLQYRHRLFCIQRVFSATDSDSQGWDWAVKRFIGSSSVVGTVTCWVITKGDVEVLKDELSGCAGWGVVMCHGARSGKPRQAITCSARQSRAALLAWRVT